MRQEQVIIGGQYRVRIGDRLAPVTVQYRKPGAGRGRFVCLTGDTGREVIASAARLRPIPGTPEAAKAAERRPSKPRGPRPFTGDPGSRMIDASPVPGMLHRVSGAPVGELSRPNADYVCRLVDACHAAERFAFVARAVRRRIGQRIVWLTIPRHLRRGLLHAAAVRHAGNRETFAAVMGHQPLPSERMVTEAVAVACGLGPMPR